MRRVEDGVHLPRPEFCRGVMPERAETADFARVDDRTTDYIWRAKTTFEFVQRMSTQLSGLLLLAATGARSAQGHPAFALLLEARDNLQEDLAVLGPSAGAVHHHHHLRRAAEAVCAAVSHAEHSLHRSDARMLDRATAALRCANQELHWAAAALPGFAVVDLRQSCCAAHMRGKY
jgi:hypothetical protein